MMDGKFTIYYADGNIMVSIIYEADQMRYYEIYRKNGQLWHELNYQDELVVSGTCHTSDGKVRDLTEAEVDNWNNKIPVDCQ